MSCGCICNVSSNMMTPVLTYGVPTPKLYQDIPNSEVVFIWGKNSKTDSGPLTTLELVKAAKARGAKIITKVQKNAVFCVLQFFCALICRKLTKKQ